MKAAYRRLGVSAVAIFLATSSYLSSYETVLGQSHHVATAPDTDVRLESLADAIEHELITSQSMPSDITNTFASAVELFPNASVAGRQELINLPKRLRAKAVEQRNAGSVVQAINLEVFADFVTKYFAYHAASAGGANAPTVTPLSVAASTDASQPSSEQTAASSQPAPPEGLRQQIQGLQQQVQALQQQVTRQNQQLAALRTNGDKDRQNMTNSRGPRRATVRRAARTLPCATQTGSMVAVTQKASWVASQLGHGCIFYQF